MKMYGFRCYGLPLAFTDAGYKLEGFFHFRNGRDEDVVRSGTVLL